MARSTYPRAAGLAAPATMRPTGFCSPVSDVLPQAVARIAQNLRPEKVVLFGSYADGVPSPDSDVDLLIIVQTDASGRDRYIAVSRLLRPRPFPVDILVKTPQEVQEALAQGDPIVTEIMARGKVLYERTS